MKELLTSLYNRALKTRDARFDASRRMARCDRFSNACIAFLSLEIIAINILQLVGKNPSTDNYVGAATIILSVFALVLSLIVNQAQYSVKTHIYTQCGLDLDELAYCINRAIKDDNPINSKDVEQFENKYISILKESNLNHEDCDYLWASRKSDFIRKEYDYDINPVSYYLFRCRLWLSHWIFSTYMIFLFITILGLLSVLALLFYKII